MSGMMTAEDREGFRVVLRAFAYESTSKSGVSIDDCDSITMTGKTVGGGEAGRASSKNRDGLGTRGCHGNRDWNQTLAATASR